MCKSLVVGGQLGFPLCLADRQFVRRNDPHAAVARRDEDEFGAAADDADLEEAPGRAAPAKWLGERARAIAGRGRCGHYAVYVILHFTTACGGTAV